MNKKYNRPRVKIKVPKGYDIGELLCMYDEDLDGEKPLYTEDVEVEFESEDKE